MATIHEAAHMGNLNRVKALLNQGAPVNSRNWAGWTPLHSAAQSGRLNVVEELLRRGAHANPRVFHAGATPLHLAAVGGHSRVMHALIKAGANPKYRNIAQGSNAYNYARFTNANPNALRTSRSTTKWQNYRKKSIARKRAPAKNVAEKVFSPARVRSMTAKYGNNWLNKI
jgi:ankyrin repeat protein